MIRIILQYEGKMEVHSFYFHKNVWEWHQRMQKDGEKVTVLWRLEQCIAVLGDVFTNEFVPLRC
jgi:hypothetical protein